MVDGGRKKKCEAVRGLEGNIEVVFGRMQS
jgi:hypothetical protein